MGVCICTYHGTTIKVAELLQCSLSPTKLNQAKEWASEASPTPCNYITKLYIATCGYGM